MLRKSKQKAKKPTQIHTHRHSILKMQKIKDKEQNLERSHGRAGSLINRRIRIRIMSDSPHKPHKEEEGRVKYQMC